MNKRPLLKPPALLSLVMFARDNPGAAGRRCQPSPAQPRPAQPGPAGKGRGLGAGAPHGEHSAARTSGRVSHGARAGSGTDGSRSAGEAPRPAARLRLLSTSGAAHRGHGEGCQGALVSCPAWLGRRSRRRSPGPERCPGQWAWSGAWGQPDRPPPVRYLRSRRPRPLSAARAAPAPAAAAARPRPPAPARQSPPV